MSISMPWSVRAVLIKYHKARQSERYIFDEKSKEQLVSELISTYLRLDYSDQSLFLVPAKGSFLRDQAVYVDFPSDAALHDSNDVYDQAVVVPNYNWPKDVERNEGFIPETVSVSSLEQGRKYDRIGGTSGRYFCPIRENGEPESYLSRALPYFIPDEMNVQSSPAYHIYTAKSDYKESEAYPKVGVISQAFRKSPDDGGGIQLVFSRKASVDQLLKERVLSGEQ